MKTLKLLAISGLVATAGISPASAAEPSKTTADFISKAAIAGMFEVESSKVALDKSKNNDVRSFAQKMVDDHSKANDELKSTVAAEKINTAFVPAKLDAKHQALLDKLNLESGSQFDKDYIKAQQDGHKDAVTLFSQYANSGDEKGLKTFADKTLPTLQEHKSLVMNLKAGK